MNARKRRPQEEAKEAEMSRKELGLDEGVDNLKAAIQVNRQVVCEAYHHFFHVLLLTANISLECI